MKSNKEIAEFTLYYNLYKKRIYNFIYKMVNDKALTEDLYQNTFMKLYEHLNNIQNKESILYWIFSTARNQVYVFYRGKSYKVDQFNKSDVDDLEIDSGDNLEQKIESKELRKIVLKEVEKLPFEQKEVYLLKEYSELKYKEIADMLNIDEGLVKSRLFKARQKLIKQIAKYI
ncbi:MAG: RNA polymerase sigma factor [Melioribacteraceae bacterium]|nr:RNA polymerase sigma factor [Melioribacteraceae bacterium]